MQSQIPKSETCPFDVSDVNNLFGLLDKSEGQRGQAAYRLVRLLLCPAVVTRSCLAWDLEFLLPTSSQPAQVLLPRFAQLLILPSRLITDI